MTRSTPGAGRQRVERAARLAAGVATALLALARGASAHAPPLGARVLPSPNGDDEVIVTNRGLVFRDPTSGASRLLCNEALRITTAELPNVAWLDDGALLVAASSGLRLSRDRGCSWVDVGGMETTNTPALATPPGDPRTVFVASYAPGNSGLLATRDGGRSWVSVVATDPSDYVHSLLVADDASHVYASLTTYVATEPPAHALLRSEDGGLGWERRPLPLDERDYAARLAGADASDPARLVLYTIANSPGLDDARVLISRDAGDSFEVALARPEIRGASHDAEGRLWVAARDGLYRETSRGDFERVSLASELGCVSSLPGSLLVCGHYAGVDAARSGVGLSRDGGQSFQALLDFQRVDAPVACDAGSLTATLCAQPWHDWELELLGAGPATGSYDAPGALAAPQSTIPNATTPEAVATADVSSVELEPTPAPPACGLSAAPSRDRACLLGWLLLTNIAGACAARRSRRSRCEIARSLPGVSASGRAGAARRAEPRGSLPSRS